MSDEIGDLRDRLKRAELLLANLPRWRDGRDGRDGVDGVGIAGENGRDGQDGRHGKDIDPEFVVEQVRARVEEAFGKVELPKDGTDGRDATPEQISEIVATFMADHPVLPGKDGEPGKRGPRGERGKKGEQGDRGPMGPMPEHEWNGTKLRFESSPGVWGEWHDLRGPRGEGGGGGGRVSIPVAPPFDLDSLGMANPAITPEETIVKQNGVWLRIGWADFLVLVGAPPPDGHLSLDGQQLSLDGLDLELI